MVLPCDWWCCLEINGVASATRLLVSMAILYMFLTLLYDV